MNPVSLMTLPPAHDPLLHSTPTLPQRGIPAPAAAQALRASVALQGADGFVLNCGTALRQTKTGSAFILPVVTLCCAFQPSCTARCQQGHSQPHSPPHSKRTERVATDPTMCLFTEINMHLINMFKTSIFKSSGICIHLHVLLISQRL